MLAYNATQRFWNQFSNKFQISHFLLVCALQKFTDAPLFRNSNKLHARRTLNNENKMHRHFFYFILVFFCSQRISIAKIFFTAISSFVSDKWPNGTVFFFIPRAANWHDEWVMKTNIAFYFHFDEYKFNLICIHGAIHTRAMPTNKTNPKRKRHMCLPILCDAWPTGLNVTHH